MEDLDNKWILRSKWWSRSPNLLIITSSAISLFLAGRRTRIAKTRTGTTRSHWAWRTCGGWAPLSSSSCSLSSSSSGVHPGRPWDSWRSWSHRRRDSLSQTQGDHHRDHHHHLHHHCGDHNLACQVRRERRAEAAKDAINRWKGTIEVTWLWLPTTCFLMLMAKLMLMLRIIISEVQLFTLSDEYHQGLDDIMKILSYY